jgi:hypothetical protein
MLPNYEFSLIKKCGVTIIKFFSIALYAQSKSVAVASIADTLAHATPTHFLSPAKIEFESKKVQQ